MDARPSDAGVVDTGTPDDAAADARAPDTGAPDTGSPDTGAPDTGAPDTGSPDTGAPDTGSGGTPVSYECVAAITGNETNSALVLSDNFWPGFRFQVPAGGAVATTGIGVNIRSSAAGTVFAALVALTGPSDGPDSANLTSSDVLATTLLPLPGGPSSTTTIEPITASLGPGWYAAVFGTNAFGASVMSASIHSNSGAGGCGSGFGYPFTLRQSDGSLILQAATPHMIVTGTRP
jgi:hypothetical protein